MQRMSLLTIAFLALVNIYPENTTAAQSRSGHLISSSGTETVYCQSGWYPTEGLAEADCYNELDGKREEVIRSLSAEGKRPIGGGNGPLNCDERVSGELTEHQCSGASDVNWEQDYTSHAKRHTGAKSEKLSLSKAGPSLLLGMESAPLSFVVLDDELLKRFRAIFGNEDMTLVSVSLLASDVSVGEKISSLPTTISEENYVAENRTDDPQTRHFRVSISTTEAERYAFTRTLVRGSNTSTTVGFNIQGVTGSSVSGLNRTLTIGSSTENNFSSTKSYEEQFEQNVNPRMAMFIKVRRETLNNTYKLQGAVLFEGVVRVTRRVKDVYACGVFNTDRCSRWKIRTVDYNLSQYLPEEQRKFDMDGVVTISSSVNTNTTITYATKPISKLPSSSLTDVPLVGPKTIIPEKDYQQIDMVPDHLEWKAVGDKEVCGFWIFKRSC